MRAGDVAKILEELAPTSLAYEGEELGFVVGAPEKDVQVLAVTERPTAKVLQEAIAQKVDMLVIHEPLYQSKKASLVDMGQLTFVPNAKREALVMQGGFCIYRYHSQWDDAEEGNNEVLARRLSLRIIDKLPYGRIGTVPITTLKAFAKIVKKSLNCEQVMVVGDGEQSISVVAVVAGTGNSLIEIMDLAKQKGADVLVSGDLQDSRARYAEELGLAVIDAGDYATENPGAKHLTDLLANRLKGVRVLHLDPGAAWKYI